MTIKRWLIGVVFVLVLSPLLSGVYTYTRGGESARVHAATASTLNFQARLQSASGALVADGSYSIQFKLYTAVTGGTNEWTETQTVTARNGYISANLGAVTPFGSTIDWSQEKWLTMNINSDGEMNPRIKLTGVPYAFRSGLADLLSITGGTLSGDNILQKAPTSVQTVSSANAGLRFDQTGSGGLIQLQGNGLDVFTVSKAGDVSAAGNLAILGGSGTFGTSSVAGSVALSDGSSNTGTLSTAALGANRTYTLPDVSGTICLTSTCGAAGLFAQNGNAFTADAVLGTTDNFALRFITNSTEKMTILANGNVGVGDTTPAALFTVGTSDALQIDASGNLLTAGTITSGLINGQTISTAANFTGTLTAAGLITANNGLTIGSGKTLSINGDAFTDLTGTGLAISGGVLNLANTAVTAASYGSSTDVATFTVDAQGRLTAAGTTKLANSALTNSSIGVSYGSANLTGDANVALGGTLNINFSATPTFTSVTTGTVTNAGMLNLTATGAGNDINLTGADQIRLDAGSTIELLDNTNLTGNLDVSGTLNIGTNDALKIDANGSLTTTFRQLDGSTTATSGSGLGGGTINVGSGTTTNFDVGNYVLVNGTYAKITAKTASSLSITPNLTWSNGATVTEYYIPEIGGTDTGSTLTNRFGRGYFISGVATGNGTTYYNEDSITTSLTSFDLLNTNVTTLNIGGAATTLNIGSSGTNVSILGSLSTAASQTITAGGGLVVSSGGINNTNGGITNTGALSGVTSITASGSITAATSNTINGLSINSGSLSGITGFSQTSGVHSITGTGAITIGGGSNALTIDSTNFDVSSAGALSGITSINMSGGISAATSNTINGLSISSGSLSGITGFTQTSGNFAMSGSGTFDTGSGAVSLNGATTVSGTNTLTVSGGLTSLGAGLSVTGDTSTSHRTYVSGITGTNGEGYFTGSSATPLTAFQGMSLGNVTYSILGTNKYFTGSAWLDNGLARNGSSLQIQNDNLYFYSFNTGTTATQRFTIASGGNVGIGTTSTTPAALLSVGGTTGNFLVTSTGVITTTTTNTINGLSINSGSLSGITGFSQTSGTFGISGTGAISLGGGSNALTIDSTAFDVTSAGAVSGITTINMSGAITAATTTNTINGLIINSGTLTGVTGITFTSGNLALGGGSITGVGSNITGNGALTIASGAATALTLDSGTTGAVNLGTSNNAKTLNIATGTAGDTINLATDNTVTDILNIGSANDTLTITSSAFKVTSAGAVSGLTTLSLSGAITGATASNTINGLIINSGSLSGITGLNQASGAFAISGTGAITLGAGSNSFAVSSTGIDITAAGAVSGVTTLSASSTINAVSGYQFNGTAGQTFTCGNNQYINQAAVQGGIITGHSACTGAGLSDQRLKTNILTMGSVLDKVKDVNVVTFDFDCNNDYFETSHTYCDPTHQTGVIAQQLATVFPELTYQDDYGIYHVKYDALAMYNFKATGEIAKKLDSQGNANLNTVSTGGALRLTQTGALQNINGLTMTSGGASIVGGLNNNNGGITSVGSLSGVTGISAQSVELAATGDQNLLTLTKDGNNVFTVFNSGALQLQLDSPQALAIKAQNGDNALTVDTLTGKIRVGSSNNAKTFLFVLDSKSTEGDPEGTNGAQYYNSDSNKFRCYQNNEWQDCVQSSYSEYTLMSVPGPWSAQPSADTEFPTQNRTWIQLRNSNQFRIVANMNAGGASGASCRIQYATNTNSSNPDWHDLSATSGSGELQINSAGALKTDWAPVAKDGKNDSLLRVMCKGGDGQASPNFASIRIQVR